MARVLPLSRSKGADMTVIFTVFPDAGEGGTMLFPSLRAAKAYVKENALTDFVIERHMMVRPTVENVIDIVNSRGGLWSAGHVTVKATGIYDTKAGSVLG